MVDFAGKTWHIVANGFAGDLHVAADGQTGTVLGSPMAGFTPTETSISFIRTISPTYQQFFAGSLQSNRDTDPTYLAMGMFMEYKNSTFSGPYMWHASIHLVG